MSDEMRQAAKKIEKYFPALSDYNKGKLVGIGEGLAMAQKSEKAPDLERMPEPKEEGASDD